MHKKIKRIFTRAKERAYTSYAKIAMNGGFCDINCIIVRSTSPHDSPLTDRYVLELTQIFSISPSSCHAFLLSFTRRFHKTQSWKVALKCLILLHRLLASVPNTSPFRADLLWARANGGLSLYPCNFRDSSSSSSEDYTEFVRSYAHLLDEALNCVSIEHLKTNEQEQEQEREREQEHRNEDFQEKMKELGRMIETLPQLQNLMDRIIDCWPNGAASTSFLVHSVMKHVIRDSFTCYTSYREEIVKVLDNLIQLPYEKSMAAFRIYKKAAIQADQLCQFYNWCKSMGFCGLYEYPFIDRIPEIQIRALESFLDGMWQMTDQSASSSSGTPSVSTPMSPNLTEDESDKQILVKQPATGLEMEPLIQWTEEDDYVGWEDLLEASISASALITTSRNSYNYVADGFIGQQNGWQMEVYNPKCSIPTPNPYYETDTTGQPPLVILEHALVTPCTHGRL